MLRGVGDPIDVHEIDPALMRTALERLLALVPDASPLRRPSSCRRVAASIADAPIDAVRVQTGRLRSRRIAEDLVLARYPVTLV